MKVKSKINVAQIGAGSFGVKRAESVQKCESAKLIAIADADKATSKKAGEILGVRALSVDEVLKNPEINLVCIATPNLHAELACASLAGKHVLCEKPVA